MDRDPTYNVDIINIETLVEQFPDRIDECLETATRWNDFALTRNGVCSGVVSWGLLVRVRPGRGWWQDNTLTSLKPLLLERRP